MFLFRFAVVVVAGSVAVSACRSPENTAATGERWWAHVTQLATDKMQGRGTGTEGYRNAAQYVVDEFQGLGLQPAGTKTFFQSVEFETRTLLEERSTLEVTRDGKVIPLRFGTEAILFPAGESGQPFDAEIVFAGYGLTIREYAHDDFAGLDVAGKVVAFLQGAPLGVPSTVAAHYSSFEERMRNLQRLGGVGLLYISNPRLEEIPWARLSAMRAQFTRTMDLTEPELSVWKAGVRVVAGVNAEHASTVLGISPARFAEILKLDTGKKPLRTFSVGGRLRGTVTYARSPATSDNVVAVMPGHDPKLKDEYVVLSAHLDHTGVGEPVNGDSINNGAMDNASGVATLLEVARMLHEASERPRRSILFFACTGEEMGLLGSKYFANRSTVPIDDVVANVNLDMFLPIIPLRTVRGYGVGESDLSVHLEAAAREIGVTVQEDPEPELNTFIRSDQYSFIKRGVPALFLSFGFEPGSAESQTVTTWFRERYHAPSDDLNQPVKLDAAARFNQFMRLLTVAIANAYQRPRWKDDSFFRTFAQRRSASTNVDGAGSARPN